MSKTAMWGIGAGLAAVLAVGFFVSMKNSAPDSASPSATATPPEKTSGTIASLVARGATVQCAVDSSAGAEVVKGTVYVSGKNVRGDFTSTIPQKGEVQSHMITDGENVYVWSSAMPQGMKMKAVAPATDSKSGPSPAGDMYSKNYDYNCSPWSSDASKFTLPTAVTFTDVSEMMKGLPMPPVSGGTSVKPPAGVDCSACDKAPASARTQCRAALGCK